MFYKFWWSLLERDRAICLRGDDNKEFITIICIRLRHFYWFRYFSQWEVDTCEGHSLLHQPPSSGHKYKLSSENGYRSSQKHFAATDWTGVIRICPSETNDHSMPFTYLNRSLLKIGIETGILGLVMVAYVCRVIFSLSQLWRVTRESGNHFAFVFSSNPGETQQANYSPSANDMPSINKRASKTISLKIIDRSSVDWYLPFLLRPMKKNKTTWWLFFQKFKLDRLEAVRERWTW